MLLKEHLAMAQGILPEIKGAGIDHVVWAEEPGDPGYVPRKGHWMQTYTGVPYWPLDPSPLDVNIRDIAHALSMLCRYTGHVRKFYSVAEHSVLMSYMVPEQHAFQALMHDATEAYVGDVGRPLKRSLDEYGPIEERNWWAICEKFGMEYQLHPDVKQADNDILLNEADALMGTPPLPWNVPNAVKRGGIVITGWYPEMAEIMFLDRFTDLGGLGR